MIYELRRYEALPGKLGALDALMQKHAVPLFEKHGMQLIGAWSPKVGDYTNVLIYLLAFESMDERDRRWEDFFNDPQWQKARLEFVDKEVGTLVARQHYTFLAGKPYSPLK